MSGHTPHKRRGVQGLIALAFFLRTAKGALKDKLQSKFEK